MKPNKFNEVKNGFYVPALMKRSWYAQIEVLKYVDSICRQNNLVYFADYGTLLGAVRHKGFIPWDDDIDIMMPRNDYNKFRKLYSSKSAPDILNNSKDQEKENPLISNNNISKNYNSMNILNNSNIQ